MTSHDFDTLAYYKARARGYDNVYLKADIQAELRAIEQWLPPIFTEKRVLEVACGTGYWTDVISRAANQVVALDLAPETIALAKARILGRTSSYCFAMFTHCRCLSNNSMPPLPDSGFPMFRNKDGGSSCTHYSRG